jgi:hypothetical protein
MRARSGGASEAKRCPLERLDERVASRRRVVLETTRFIQNHAAESARVELVQAIIVRDVDADAHVAPFSA